MTPGVGQEGTRPMEFPAPGQENVLDLAVTTVVPLLLRPADHPELVLSRVITAEDLEQLTQSSRPVLLAEHSIAPRGQHLGQGEKPDGVPRGGPYRRSTGRSGSSRPT